MVLIAVFNGESRELQNIPENKPAAHNLFGNDDEVAAAQTEIRETFPEQRTLSLQFAEPWPRAMNVTVLSLMNQT